MISGPLGVVPVLVGPLQILLAILPALLVSLGGLLLGLLRPRAVVFAFRMLWRQKLAVAVFGGVTVGAVFFARGFFPNHAPAVTAEETGAADWPMFRGDAQRRGAGGNAPPPTCGGLHWSFAGEVKTFYATPAVVGNRVYVTSADKGPLRDRGAIYCLDADTGGAVWKAAPPGFRATFSSPAVSGRFLVCGEGLHYTYDARVVCLDLGRGGEVLWTYPTNSHVESSPCIHGDCVYIGAGDDGYYCLRLEPDASGQPVVVWHLPAEQYPDAETSPAVCDGRVFVGLGMGGKAICALRADSGEQLWRVPTPYPVFGPPTVVEGLVVVGMGNGNFVQSAEEVCRIELQKLREQGQTAEQLAAAEKLLGPAGEIWCLSAETGEVRWKFAVGQTVLGAVAAGEDRLYFGSRDGHLYCLSLAGKLLGKWNAHAPIVTSPALANGHVYVVTERGKLFGLRADELDLVWEATLGFTGPFLSSPSVARGHVYVGSQQDGLLCLGQPGAETQAPLWAGPLGGPGQAGQIDGQPLPERGRLAWRFPPETQADGDQPPELSVTAAPACLGERLFVPVKGSRSGMLALHQEQAAPDRIRPLWFLPVPEGVGNSPAANSASVFFVSGKTGSSQRWLYCVEFGNGTLQWRLPVAPTAPGTLLLLDDGGLIADRPGELACLDLSGNIKWRTCITAEQEVFDRGPAAEPACCDDIVVAVVKGLPQLVAIDRPTGKILWRTSLDNLPAGGPVIRKNTVYLGSPEGVTALRLADGGQLWQSHGGRPATRLVFGPSWLCYGTVEGRLVLLDGATGEFQAEASGALAGLAPLVWRETLLYATASGLMRWQPTGGQPRLWMRTDWLGQITCPPVMSGSRVYFATDKRGLISAKGKPR